MTNIRHFDAETEAGLQQRQACTIRQRLLNELDDLEITLRGVREMVETLPAEEMPQAQAQVSALLKSDSARPRWKLWKHS